MFTEFQVFLDKIRNIFFQVDGLRKIFQIYTSYTQNENNIQ